jgi:hypothetical protein
MASFLLGVLVLKEKIINVYIVINKYIEFKSNKFIYYINSINF